MLVAFIAGPAGAMAAQERVQVAGVAKDSVTKRDAQHRAEISFAYSNSGGTALLAVGDLDPAIAARLDRGVCEGGRIVNVKFSQMQLATNQSTGRNVAENFEADRGARFAVVGGTASRVCLLVRQDFLTDKHILPITQQSTRGNKRVCESGLRSRIPALQKRALIECTFVASLGTGAQLVASLYTPQGNNLLAALVVSTQAGMFVHPLPGDGGWRADDDGELNADYISPMFTLVGKDGSLDLALTWPGPEGDDLLLYRTLPQGVLEEVLVGNLYNGPT